MKDSSKKTNRKPCAEEAAFVEMLLTTEALSRPFAQLLKSEDISATQYNVLRILRGSPDGLSCSEIGNRMISHDPDITRLLDRMEKRGLISRNRDEKDRRTVLTRITNDGLALLERMDNPVQDTHRGQLSHLGREKLNQLVELLRLCRREDP